MGEWCNAVRIFCVAARMLEGCRKGGVRLMGVGDLKFTRRI